MTLLQELEAAGVNEVTVVVGHLGEQIRDLLDGFSVRFAEQPEVLGSADALRRAVDAGARPPFVVSVADTVFAPGDLRRFAETWEQSGADGALAPPLWGVGPEVLRQLDDLPGPPYELQALFSHAQAAGTDVRLGRASVRSDRSPSRPTS